MNSDIEKIVAMIKEETDPFQKAQLMKKIIKEHELKISELAPMLSMKPAYICHLLRLNYLPEIVVDGYYNRQITLSHLFVISRLKEKEKIMVVYEKVLADGLTVLQTEALVREINYGIKTEGELLTEKDKDQLINTIKKKIKDAQIKIIQTRVKSKIIIEVKGSLKKTSAAIKQLLNPN